MAVLRARRTVRVIAEICYHGHDSSRLLLNMYEDKMAAVLFGATELRKGPPTSLGDGSKTCNEMRFVLL